MLYDDLENIYDGDYSDTLFDEVDELYENYDSIINYLGEILLEE